METEAAQFLAALAPDGDLTFATFTDGPKSRPDRLAGHLHGSYARHQPKLADRNGRGAGAFVMVNRGDGRGRTNSSVVAVRAVFVDLDGAPLDAVLAAPIAPPIVCESSPGKYHAYWPVSGMPLIDFRNAQRALAARFGGDPAVCDLARVMRLPGFVHRKAEPFRSRLLHCDPVQPWQWSDLAAALGLPCSAQPAPDSYQEGERNSRMFRFACGLKRDGLEMDVALSRVMTANAERCTPPLDDEEIRAVVISAWQTAQAGYTSLPNALLDSELFRALSPSAKVAVVALARKYHGSNNGDLTWTRTEAKSWGFTKERRTNALVEAEQAGLIEYTARGQPPMLGGRPTPDKFRLVHLP